MTKQTKERRSGDISFRNTIFRKTGWILRVIRGTATGCTNEKCAAGVTD
ncbi:hypothetical protein (plasmid) [Erwinia amylovora ATCC 49946]|nr:hypothetical protein [Erwinia amylovora ATCC 49946]